MGAVGTILFTGGIKPDGVGGTMSNRLLFADKTTKVRLVIKNNVANHAVVLVKKFADPRAERNPDTLPPPSPKPPPSLFCSKTIPTSKTAIIVCITRIIVVIKSTFNIKLIDKT
jgi:hypothetical protein